uniref:Hamartin n=4 Tax=Lygus hesperus TaxID=30085 RepID=A0A0A9Z668_LYGHE
MEAVHFLFHNLESNTPQIAEEARTRFHEYFNSTKESWLLNGIIDYFIQTGSLRIVDVIVGVREPHERFFFDRMSDSIRSSHNKLQVLTLLGHVVCRHPSWLYKIMHHNLIKDLLRLLKAEKDVSVLMSALLIMIILLPTIAGLMGPYLQDLFDVFSHLASWNTNNPNKVPENQLLHLQVGLYALFNRLYGMYPCNFLNYLRSQYSIKENHLVFAHTIKPMLDTVRIHPFLVTASKESEVSPARWKKMEANDVIMECAKFSVDTSPERSKDECFRSRAASFRARPIDYSASLFEKSQMEEENEKQVGGFSANLPGHEIWSPTVYTGTTTPPEAASITHTPITQAYISSTTAYSSQEGNSPPEAAIEATPESTPVKDLRQPVFRASAGLSRSLVQSQPSSPLRKDSSPFKYPPNSSTPLPGHEVPGSAFQQQPPSKAKDTSKLFANKLQRMHQERVLNQTEEEIASVAKGKVGAAGGGYYSPASPLRLITPSPSLIGSPHPPDRSEEDKEVETTMQTNQSGSSLKRTSSMKRDEENEEHDECRLEENQADGGLRFPDSRAMQQFARRVNRLRFHSQCQPDPPTIQLANIGTSSGSSPREGNDFPGMSVRRAVSCPEMKKDAAGAFTLDPCSTTLDETEEEQEEAEGASILIKSTLAPVKEILDCGTQTEDQPMVYEHMFLSVFPVWEQIQLHSAPPDLNPAPTFQEPMFSPRTALESYVAATIRNLNERRSKPDYLEIKTLKDQVELLMYQLQFERHRREVHAERNRRLLGKSRANRALEEHNSALRDQIILMHKDIETLHVEMEMNKGESKQQCDNLQHDVNYWKDQSNAIQKKLKETDNDNALLRKELDEQRNLFSNLAKKFALAQSQIFDMDNTVQDTKIAASSSSELKGEIARLQHHLISAGELEMRLRSSLNTLNLNCHKDMEAILGNMAYTFSLSGLKAELKNRTSACHALKAKVTEVEKALKKEENLCLEGHKLAKRIEETNKTKLEELAKNSEELKQTVAAKEEEMLSKNATIQKLEKQLEKLLSSKDKEDKASTAPETSRSLEPGIPSSSDHLSVAAGGVRLQNLQNLVQSFEDLHGSQ